MPDGMLTVGAPAGPGWNKPPPLSVVSLFAIERLHMSDQKKTSPFTPPAYQGDQDADRLPYEGPAIRTQPDPENGGRRAVREGSGVVSGSRAGAGGTAGISEDYNEDSAGGGGPNVMPAKHDK